MTYAQDIYIILSTPYIMESINNVVKCVLEINRLGFDAVSSQCDGIFSSARTKAAHVDQQSRTICRHSCLLPRYILVTYAPEHVGWAWQYPILAKTSDKTTTVSARSLRSSCAKQAEAVGTAVGTAVTTGRE